MDLTQLDLMKFIPGYLVILIAAAYVLGSILKGMNSFKDKYITLVLGIFCITIAIALIIINGQYKVMLDAVVNGLLQGIIAWGISIGINQTIKQLNKNE